MNSSQKNKKTKKKVMRSFPFQWKDKNVICNYNDNVSRLYFIHQKEDFAVIHNFDDGKFDCDFYQR